MTITTSMVMSLFADITPADALATSTYRIGHNAAAGTIPAAADLVYSVAMTTSNGVAKVFEPDTGITDGGTAPTNPDGGVIAMATVYALALQNTHATLEASYTSANFGSVVAQGLLQAGSINVHHFPAGLAIGATATISITGLSGTPVVNILLIGAE